MFHFMTFVLDSDNNSFILCLVKVRAIMSSAENEIYPTGFIIIVVIIAIKLSFSEGLL